MAIADILSDRVFLSQFDGPRDVQHTAVLYLKLCKVSFLVIKRVSKRAVFF